MYKLNIKFRLEKNLRWFEGILLGAHKNKSRLMRRI